MISFSYIVGTVAVVLDLGRVDVSTERGRDFGSSFGGDDIVIGAGVYRRA
jgi:hypothetical protein